MNNTPDFPFRFIEDIYATQDNEIQCEQAMYIAARCAEELLPEEEVRQRYPLLYQHFRFCPDCEQEYRMMMMLARLDATGQLERPEHIPPPPELGRPSRAGVEDVATKLFPGFSLVRAAAAVRSVNLTFEPVEVVLVEDVLYISFDMTRNERDPTLRDLFCFVLTDDEALTTAVEGTSMCLHKGDNGPVIREASLNEDGDAYFWGLSPGQYTLHLRLAGHNYVIKDITLPSDEEIADSL